MDLRGQVGVVTQNPTQYGRLIQDITHSPAFHIVTNVGDPNNTGEDWVMSAEVPYLLLRPASFYPGLLWTHVQFPDDEHRDDAVNFVLAQEGKRYAYLDIALLFIAIELKEKTPLVIQDRLRDTDQWFCSELGDMGLRVGGVNLFGRRPAAAVMPKDFLPYAS